MNVCTCLSRGLPDRQENQPESARGGAPTCYCTCPRTWSRSAAAGRFLLVPVRRSGCPLFQAPSRPPFPSGLVKNGSSPAHHTSQSWGNTRRTAQTRPESTAASAMRKKASSKSPRNIGGVGRSNRGVTSRASRLGLIISTGRSPAAHTRACTASSLFASGSRVSGSMGFRPIRRTRAVLLGVIRMRAPSSGCTLPSPRRSQRHVGTIAFRRHVVASCIVSKNM
mmetsp:Transcript_11454/g.26298  ORF Transcript_11454/g.26298 Transcript_11454/m.26298 type:complete len:224 (+) Transcript_11454:120-791(+)